MRSKEDADDEQAKALCAKKLYEAIKAISNISCELVEGCPETCIGPASVTYWSVLLAYARDMTDKSCKIVKPGGSLADLEAYLEAYMGERKC